MYSFVIAAPKSKKQSLTAGIAKSADVIPSLRSIKRDVEMSKKSIMREAKKRGIKITLDKSGNPKAVELKGNLFFLPEDLKKLKGKWSLYIKKGVLIRLDKAEVKK
jgi:hypothetical protein